LQFHSLDAPLPGMPGTVAPFAPPLHTIAESLYIENWGIILPRFTRCVANIVHLTTLTFQCDFSTKRVWPNITSETVYVKSLPTP